MRASRVTEPLVREDRVVVRVRGVEIVPPIGLVGSLRYALGESVSHTTCDTLRSSLRGRGARAENHSSDGEQPTIGLHRSPPVRAPARIDGSFPHHTLPGLAGIGFRGHADDAKRRGPRPAHRSIVLTTWRPFDFVRTLLTSAAADAPSSARPYPTSRTSRSFIGCTKWMRVLRRVTSGLARRFFAISFARVSARPRGTISATTPRSFA